MNTSSAVSTSSKRLERRIVGTLSALAVGAFAAALFLPRAEPAVTATPDGRELFTRYWQWRAPDAAHGDGLGPLFNARSCGECHKQGGVGGGGPNENNVQLINVAGVPLE